MPVCLLTFQAHGPRTEDGQPRYFLRNEPSRRARVPLAERYRQAIEDREVVFDADHQRKLIDIVMDGQRRETYRCFGAAANDGELHVLVAWNDEQEAIDVQAQLKARLSREMNREFGRQSWLGDGGGAKRVRNRTQFDYLLDTYLPRQSETCWTATQGFATKLAASA